MSKSEQIKNCFSAIYTFCEINNFSDNLKNTINTFFSEYLKKRRVPTTLQLNIMLEKLFTLSSGNEKMALSIVNKSIEMGWASFYPLTNYRSIDNIPKKQTVEKPIKLAEERF